MQSGRCSSPIAYRLSLADTWSGLALALAVDNDLAPQVIFDSNTSKYVRDPHSKDTATESVILSSRANNGVHFVVTTQNTSSSSPAAADGDGGGAKGADSDARSSKRQKPAGTATYHHFSEQNVDRFYSSQNKRQGVGTLAFQVEAGGCDKIFER